MDRWNEAAGLHDIIVFDYEHAHYELNSPQILDIRLPDFRKISQYICNSNDYEKKAAYQFLNILQTNVEVCDHILKQEAKRYSNEYRAVRFAENPEKAKKDNKKLEQALKAADRDYKRAIKIRDIFVEMANKYKTFDN